MILRELDMIHKEDLLLTIHPEQQLAMKRRQELLPLPHHTDMLLLQLTICRMCLQHHLRVLEASDMKLPLLEGAIRLGFDF